MAQDEQEALISWLKENKLNFMKDALVEEKYTLEMIEAMTNDEINGICVDLNIPHIKRPRFRVAVQSFQNAQTNNNNVKKQTQQSHNTIPNENKKENKIKKQNVKEETLESLLSSQDSQTLSNPYIIISGIEDYSQSKPKGMWPDLNGVSVDVKNMINLWYNTYNYKNISVAFNNCEKKEASHNENQGIHTNNKLDYNFTNIGNLKIENSKISMSNIETYNDFLVNIRATINFKNCNDGLIFYYSGHGVKNAIILSNGVQYKIRDIIEIFNNKECIVLRNKPKIMIFDCCRGSQICETYDAKMESDDNINKSNNVLKGLNNKYNEWINHKFHKNSNLAIIFGNFEDYSISDSDYGGHLTRSIVKVFENPKEIINHNYSLQKLIIAIRKQTKMHSGKGNINFGVPNQLVEVRETLEYEVYFKTHDMNNKIVSNFESGTVTNESQNKSISFTVNGYQIHWTGTKQIAFNDINSNTEHTEYNQSKIYDLNINSDEKDNELELRPLEPVMVNDSCETEIESNNDEYVNETVDSLFISTTSAVGAAMKYLLNDEQQKKHNAKLTFNKLVARYNFKVEQYNEKFKQFKEKNETNHN